METEIRKLRKSLGKSREEMAEVFNIKKRTWDGSERGDVKIKKINMVIEKMENMLKEHNSSKTGLNMLDKFYDDELLFTAEQALIVAKAVICYQLSWYKAHKTKNYYKYTPEILEKTLNDLSIDSIRKLSIDLDIDELVEKKVAFISIKQIEEIIDISSIFIY